MPVLVSSSSVLYDSSSQKILVQGEDEPEGACCIDGICGGNTEAGCIEAGGIYQGDDTSCDPNPCPEPDTGACCHEDHSCTETSEEDCDGIFMGNGVTCEGGTCETGGGACCDDENAFPGFLGIGWYRTISLVSHYRATFGCPGEDTPCVVESNQSVYRGYDPPCHFFTNTLLCELTVECEGSEPSTCNPCISEFCTVPYPCTGSATHTTNTSKTLHAEYSIEIGCIHVTCTTEESLSLRCDLPGGGLMPPP